MKFDKSKVYTALNADELKVGSKCIFADTASCLRQAVQDKEFDTHVQILTRVSDDDSVARFLTSSNYQWLYAYLIEPPAEPKYLPFASNNKAMEAIKKHGGWVKHKNEQYSFITAIDIGEEDEYEIKIDDDWLSADELLKNYVFADDGSPCGERDK